MPNVVADCETHLITDTDLAPPLVCVSICWRTPDTGVRLLKILARDDAGPTLANMLECWTMIGHRICYDLAVILRAFPSLRQLVDRAWREGRIRDTRIREAMILGLPEPWRAGVDSRGDAACSAWRDAVGHDAMRAITLAGCAMKYSGRVLKESGWGLRFAELDGIPVCDWPSEAVVYCHDDIIETENVYRAQGGDLTPDEREHLLVAWAVHQQHVAARAAARL